MNVDEEVPLRTLLVDDSRSEAALVGRLLLMAGAPRFDVVAVHSLTDALTVLESRRMDLVILDLGLPDVDAELAGLEAIRLGFPHTPVIVLTGLERSETLRAAALKAGAVELLFKHGLNPEWMHQTLYKAVRVERSVLAENMRIAASAIARA